VAAKECTIDEDAFLEPEFAAGALEVVLLRLQLRLCLAVTVRRLVGATCHLLLLLLLPLPCGLPQALTAASLPLGGGHCPTG
jgi:hypothetical protein